jgi:RNA polymerase sigma-70 factor (ECF subfamily)
MKRKQRTPYTNTLSGNFDEDVIALIPALRSFARTFTSGPEVEDLVQDTLCRALSHKDQYHPSTNLKAWLFTILKHLFFDYCKRAGREIFPGDDCLHTGGMPSQEWMMHFAQVNDALTAMRPANRQALLLVSEGVSYDDTAAKCGCEVGTIKSRVSRAREQLAHKFPDLFNIDDPFAAIASDHASL